MTEESKLRTAIKNELYNAIARAFRQKQELDMHSFYAINSSVDDWEEKFIAIINQYAEGKNKQLKAAIQYNDILYEGLCKKAQQLEAEKKRLKDRWDTLKTEISERKLDLHNISASRVVKRMNELEALKEAEHD